MSSIIRGIKDIVVNPTNSTSAYVAGQQFGTLQTLSGVAPAVGYGAVLQSITVADKSKQSAAFDFYIFGASPTVTSTDRTTVNITDANLFGLRPKVVQLTTYSALSGNSLGFANALGCTVAPLPSLNSVDMYLLIVIQASATYGASLDVEFTLSFLQDAF